MEKLASKLIHTFIVLLIFAATISLAGADSLDDAAARGEGIANADPLASELRNQQPEGPIRRGFDIGMGIAEGNTLPGPGKDRICASLPLGSIWETKTQPQACALAVQFSVDRNRYVDLAKRGTAIAMTDPVVAAARNATRDVFYRLGFDIGLGAAEGQTLPGPGKDKIRDSLQRSTTREGFSAAVSFTLERNRKYAVMETSDRGGVERATAAKPPVESAIDKFGAGPAAVATGGEPTVAKELLKAPFINDVQVAPGWNLIISFNSTQKTKPLVEIGPVPPVRDRNGILTFPVGSGAVSRFVSSDSGQYYSEFDVLREGFEANKSYYYIINVFNDNPGTIRNRDQETGRFTMAGAGYPAYICEDAHIVRGVDGSASECFPYHCIAGQCQNSCNSINNCLSPTVCNPNNKCEYPSSDDGSSDDW